MVLRVGYRQGESPADVVDKIEAGIACATRAWTLTPAERPLLLRSLGVGIVSSRSQGSAPATSSSQARCCAAPRVMALGRSRVRASAPTYTRTASGFGALLPQMEHRVLSTRGARAPPAGTASIPDGP
jgi:hypothetical protein